MLLPYHSFASERKQFTASPISQTIIIDGKLNEAQWHQAQLASQFKQVEPYSGKSATFDTRVYVLYDDKALYIGAYLHDPQPDSISFELRSRDNLGMADAFGVKIDPFNDGLNAFGFVVTARGVQIDMKTNSNDNDDFSWDAVWKSETAVLSDGWSVEMMIPYSALRFPKKIENQLWGINFFRLIQRYRELSSWNYIDLKSKGINNQAGQLQLLNTIEPPFRFSATPYLSSSASHNSVTKKWSSGYNYGMDLKIGLSESFTLDMTLIPDFGQVESDEKIFSLSPYEVYYSEKRPFFTEGTELFSKGNLFYSRRIGATPGGFYNISAQYTPEQIIDNPESAQLLNAAKLSGKTSKGLGIGVFNAITSNTFAIIKDSLGAENRILTEPFSNFNMVVLEQALPNNSQISIYNSNVAKPDSEYMANVSGTGFVVKNKSNIYELSGMLNVSQHYAKDKAPAFGESLQVSASKISGNFQPNIWLSYVSNKYNPNDFGYLAHNNEISNGLSISYRTFEPKGKVLKWTARFRVEQNYLYQPRQFTHLELGGDSRFTFTNHLTMGGNFHVNPLGVRDYYEPRTTGRYFYKPTNFRIGFFGSPDYRKKILADYRLSIRSIPQFNQGAWTLNLSPRWRAQDNFVVQSGLGLEYQYNNRGFVRDSINSNNNKVIIFGRRNVRNITLTLAADYIFTPKASITLRLRHYWLDVDYKSFYDLNTSGNLIASSYNKPENFLVNAFNVDMVFKYDFAPGSELLLVWKNAVYMKSNGNAGSTNYFKNLENTFNAPIGNSLSIKLLYYLDWQQFKTVKKIHRIPIDNSLD